MAFVLKFGLCVLVLMSQTESQINFPGLGTENIRLVDVLEGNFSFRQARQTSGKMYSPAGA